MSPTVHGDLVALSAVSLAITVDRLLGGSYGEERVSNYFVCCWIPWLLTASLLKSVGVHGPVALLPVVGNGLDKVTVGGAHTNPQGGDSIGGAAARAVREDKSRGSFTDEGVVGDGTSAESRTHGGVHAGCAKSSKSCENLGAGVHFDGVVYGRCE